MAKYLKHHFSSIGGAFHTYTGEPEFYDIASQMHQVELHTPTKFEGEATLRSQEMDCV